VGVRVWQRIGRLRAVAQHVRYGTVGVRHAPARVRSRQRARRAADSTRLTPSATAIRVRAVDAARPRPKSARPSS
jgi:hypothetical protein